MPQIMLRLGATLSVALALASCQGPVASQGASTTPEVTVRGQVALQGVSRAYRLAGVVREWTATDVAKVRVYLSRTDANSPTTAESSLGELPGGASGTIELRHLKMNATYRVRLVAQTAANEYIEENATNAANPDLGLSTTLVETTNVDRIDNVNFRLRLRDVIFDGMATGNVGITPGQVVDHPASEALGGI